MLDRGQCAVARTRGGRSAKGAAGSTSCAAPPKGREHLGEMGGNGARSTRSASMESEPAKGLM